MNASSGWGTTVTDTDLRSCFCKDFTYLQFECQTDVNLLKRYQRTHSEYSSFMWNEWRVKYSELWWINMNVQLIILMWSCHCQKNGVNYYTIWPRASTYLFRDWVTHFQHEPRFLYKHWWWGHFDAFKRCFSRIILFCVIVVHVVVSTTW